MKTQNLLTTMLLFVAGLCISMQTMASPLVDTLNVQGYMKKANGTAVSDGTYSMVYGVFQNGTALWAQTVSTTITNGLFSASLNGSGTNLLALPAGTGMNANYSATS